MRYLVQQNYVLRRVVVPMKLHQAELSAQMLRFMNEVNHSNKLGNRKKTGGNYDKSRDKTTASDGQGSRDVDMMADSMLYIKERQWKAPA